MPPECGVPPAVEAVVRKALEKRAEDRYADAREMRLALRDAVTSSAADPSFGLSGLFPTPDAPVTPAPPPPEPSRVERLILFAAGTLTATAVLLAGWTVARILLALWRGVVAG
jgi:serine/threonine-protein kinase